MTTRAVDTDWDEALRSAVGRGEDDGSLLFVENREDLSLELVADAAAPRGHAVLTAGMAARGPFARPKSTFRSDPRPEDAAWLMAMALGTRRELPRVEDVAPLRVPAVAVPGAESAGLLLELLVRRSRALAPSAAIRARWIGFRQTVRVARPGRDVQLDRRSGARIRLEIGLENGRGRSLAVGERVLPPEPARAERRLQHLADDVARRAEERLGAVSLPPGERRVVFAPGVGGVLVHELIGHSLEADAILAERSWLSGDGFRGPADLRVLDDPRRGRAAWETDDEGEAAGATQLVRAGRVVGWLCDLACARRAVRRPTGHGRRSTFRDPVRPRMGCTFLAAGRLEPEEVLGGLSNGIYVRRMEAASVDPSRGTAVFRVTDADRIRDGRPDGPLKPHLLHVDGPQALANVDRVARDLELDTCIGTCLRDGQPLATSVGGPTFRIGLATASFYGVR